MSWAPAPCGHFQHRGGTSNCGVCGWEWIDHAEGKREVAARETSEIDRLRAALATMTAERDEWLRKLDLFIDYNTNFSKFGWSQTEDFVAAQGAALRQLKEYLGINHPADSYLLALVDWHARDERSARLELAALHAERTALIKWAEVEANRPMPRDVLPDDYAHAHGYRMGVGRVLAKLRGTGTGE